jgi:hypothetical protein
MSWASLMALAVLFWHPFLRLKRILSSATKLEESEQHLVAFCRKRVDGA